MGDEIDDHLVACERTAAPVFGDKAKEAMLDFIPLASHSGKIQLQFLRFPREFETSRQIGFKNFRSFSTAPLVERQR
jgi:hypothetical protein